MPKKKTRRFCVTNYNMDTDYEKLVEGRQVRYCEVGDEICPTTKRPHHQVWIYMVNQKGTGKRSLNKIGNLFGSKHCHVEPTYGNWEENEAYISKDGNWACYGDKPKQGARGDLDETKKLLLAGEITVDQICEENPMMYHQYGRTLSKLETIALRKKWRKWMTKGIWYTGDTGVGKSHKAFEGYNPETHFVKDLSTKWWDGYKGQETVILNEFSGQLKWCRLMDLVDKWPCMVCIRNQESVPFLAKTVIVTSINHPDDIYTYKMQIPKHVAEFKRRFKIHKLERK